MKVRKIPMRSCVVTKEKLPKQELIRVVRTPEGNVIVDITGKANGRGAYLKKDISVIDKAEKTKVLNRFLEIEVNKQIFDELRNLIK
ncbi:MAG TPA: YlxR family protein [Tenericutes bacterium]|nr:YlxR family protein [Mycoplasmatota bacterium]